jgi:Protein of unknown function (DUF1488)
MNCSSSWDSPTRQTGTPANYDSITSVAAALPCTASDQVSPYTKQKPNGRPAGKPALGKIRTPNLLLRREKVILILLIFHAPEERYDSNRDVVVFWGLDRNQRIQCVISEEALGDHFDGDNKNKLETFRSNRQAIEDIARRKYLSGRIEPDGTVLIRTADIPN